MEFLAPLMLLGLGGAAIPVLIHLFGRRRARVVRFGAMDFLLGRNRKNARWLRVRELLLLGLRVLVALAIPLAIAKPLVSCSARPSATPTVARGPQAVVLVLDNGMAMGYRQDGETLFDAAKSRARQMLTALGPEAEVAVVTTVPGKDLPVELSRDHLRLGDAIVRTRLEPRAGDVPLALRRAGALLAGSTHANRHVYVITARQRASFPSGPTGGGDPWAGAPPPAVEIVDVSGGEPLANVAVVGARARRDPELGARGVRVVAELANFGPEKVSDRAVTVWLDGKSVARGLVTLAPGETAQKQFSLTLPAGTRAADVVVEAAGDALASDDRRHLRVALHDEIRVLVVDGDPRTVRHDDEVFYAELALRPGDRADSAVAVTVTSAPDLPSRRLAEQDVVFLCNVPALDPAQVAELRAWVEKGGGLLLSVGDRVDADAYAARMGPLLAQPLRTAFAVAPGATQDEREKRGERIGRFEPRHPVFTIFSAGGGELREATFWNYFLLGGGSGGSSTTLVRFENGAPLLVEDRAGAGRLLLFASSLDRDWNNLAIHPGYLPLMQQMARYLARSPTREAEAEVLVGRPRQIPIGPDDERLEIATPGGARHAFQGDKLRGRASLSFERVTEPGFYRVSAVDSSGRVRPRRVNDFAANLEPAASDTRPVDAAVLRALSGTGPDAQPTAGASATPVQHRRRVELWHGVAAGLLLFLLGEAVVAGRRA